MNPDDEISKFFDFVDQEIKRVIELPHKRHRRILLLALLDTLSKCAFPENRKNRERFIKFIDDFSRWPDKDRVSLVQLKYLLDRTNDASCAALKEEVVNRLDKWQAGKIQRPDSDPLIRDFDRLHDGNKEIIKVINKTRYAELIWTMRNFSVHEFRDRGAPEISNDNSTPYYFMLDTLNARKRDAWQTNWELCIPSEFIARLVSGCISNLRFDLTSRRVNPYDSFDFGRSWYSPD